MRSRQVAPQVESADTAETYIQITKERITMKRKLLVGSLMVIGCSLSLAAAASDLECFPLCAEPAKAETTREQAVVATPDAAFVAAHRDGARIGEPDASTSCDSSFIKAADDLNDKVKPIREIVGYVRSPQGLVIKLVNDHIVKIPAWIGYAMDPIGSLKHKAIDEVRTRARDALVDGSACSTGPAPDPFDADDTIDTKHSI
jgi:hypothetical protein